MLIKKLKGLRMAFCICNLQCNLIAYVGYFIYRRLDVNPIVTIENGAFGSLKNVKEL